MTRRKPVTCRGARSMRFALVVLLVAVGWLLAASVSRAAAAEDTRPNIVLLVSDNQGSADLGFRGSQIRTPHIDRLADQGVVLDAHYVFTHCSPTRVGLMLGRNPSRYGILGAIGQRSRQAIPADSVTMAAALLRHGYVTGICGKWHLGLRSEVGPKHFGFDHTYGFLHGQIDPLTHLYKNGDRTWHRDDVFLDEPGHVTDLIVAEAVERIRTWRDRPYFLYVPFNAPHGPYVEERRWLDPYQDVFDEPSQRLYAASITHMDDGIGQIVAALDETGQRERTLVVFFSDNGGVESKPASKDYEGRYGAYAKLADNRPYRGWFGECYEGGLRAPAVVSWPSRLAARTIDSVVSVLDWYPTLLDAAGAAAPADWPLEGQSIWPLLTDDVPPSPATLYWRTNGQLALRQGEWKLIVNEREPTAELYDLTTDPYEQQDVSLDHADRVRRLLRLIAEQAERDALPPPNLPDIAAAR